VAECTFCCGDDVLGPFFVVHGGMVTPFHKKKSATSPSPAPMSGGTNSTLAPPQTHPRYFLFSRLYVFFSVFFVFLVAKKKYKYGGTKS